MNKDGFYARSGIVIVMGLKKIAAALPADPGKKTYILLTVALSLASDFWPLFQFATYNRRYFEGFTTFNIIGLILTLLLAVLVLISGKKLSNYYPILFLISLFLLILIHILGILSFPVMASPSKQASILLLGVFSSTLGYPAFLGLLFFSIVNFGCLICWASSFGMSNRFWILVPFLGLGLFLLGKLGFSPSLKDLWLIGAVTGASALSLLVATPRKLLHLAAIIHTSPSDETASNPSEPEKREKIGIPIFLNIFLLLLSWAIHLFLLFCLGFFYFQLHSSPNFSSALVDFFLSLLLGAGVLALLGLSQFFLRIGRYILLFVGCSCTFLFFSRAMIRFEVTGPDFIMGFAFIVVLMNFIQDWTRRMPPQVIGPAIILAVLVSNYTVNIPSHDWEIYRAADMSTVLLWVLTILLGGLSVFRILRSGNWPNHQTKGDDNDEA